jgi:hypothetical protein
MASGVWRTVSRRITAMRAVDCLGAFGRFAKAAA